MNQDDPASAKKQVEERKREFRQDHSNFDPHWVRSILSKVTDETTGLLPFIFAGKGLERGFRAFYEGSGIELPPDFDWSSSDLPTNSLEKLPLYRNYLAVRAYAYYGLRENDNDEDKVTWDCFLEHAAYRSTFPKEWLEEDEEVNRTIKAAWARTKLDNPNSDEGLASDELAALAGVSRKSILNLLSLRSSGPFKTNSDGSIEIETARQWLLGRADFRPSILHEEMHLRGAEIDGVPVFVPVDGDVWFSPEHAVGGRFHVTNGRQRTTFDDYWVALDFLSRARAPGWRFRDEIGQWRERAAVRWDRKTRQEVERSIASMRRRKPRS